MADLVVILTAAQASAMTTQDSPYTAIVPVALSDGRFIISASVFSDPAHIAKVQANAIIAGIVPVDVSTISNLLINQAAH